MEFLFDNFNLPISVSLLIHRSGMNSSGSGKYSSKFDTTKCGNITWVCGKMEGIKNYIFFLSLKFKLPLLVHGIH